MLDRGLGTAGMPTDGMRPSCYRRTGGGRDTPPEPDVWHVPGLARLTHVCAGGGWNREDHQIVPAEALDHPRTPGRAG
jgi:hypothetical protein